MYGIFSVRLGGHECSKRSDYYRTIHKAFKVIFECNCLEPTETHENVDTEDSP